MRFSSKNVLQKYSNILQLSRKELTFINQSYSFTAQMSAKGWFSYKNQVQQNKQTHNPQKPNQIKKKKQNQNPTTKPKQQLQNNKKHTKQTNQTTKTMAEPGKDNFHLPLWVMLKKLHTNVF